MNKIMDWYFRWPVTLDFVLAIVFFSLERSFKIIPFKFIDKKDIGDFISNLIGTNVSLAGFILAALTIIVSFKANIKSRAENQQLASTMDLLLYGENYNRIVLIFKKAITELVLLVLVLYVVWLCAENFGNITVAMILPPSVAIMIFTIWRSLFVLFSVMKTDQGQTEL